MELWWSSAVDEFEVSISTSGVEKEGLLRDRPSSKPSSTPLRKECEIGYWQLGNTYKSNLKLEETQKHEYQQQYDKRRHHKNVRAAWMREEIEDIERRIRDVQIREDVEAVGEQRGRQFVREEVAGGVVRDGG